MALTLPTYIPLAEAVKRYHVNVETLTRAVESGMIRAVQINGEVAVADEDITALTKRALLWTKVKHLDGVPIGIEDACKKYELGTVSIYHWIDLGYVRVLEDQRGGGRGNKRMLNEADVAYASLVANERGRRPGKRIFTQEFVPPHLLAST